MSAQHSFYLTNYFLNYTEHSRKKMIDVVAYFMSAINQGMPDTVYQRIFDRTDPLFTLYKNKFNTWKLSKEAYQGATLNLTQGFVEMLSKIENIQSKVIGEYTSKSDEYKSIFRDGIEVFSSDTYYQRIQHVDYLRDRLGLYVPMAAAKLIAENLYTFMTGLRDIQQQRAKSLREASEDLEACRVDLGDMMYGNTGLLMDKFFKTREKIAGFYDFNVLYGRAPKAAVVKQYHVDAPVNDSVRIAILITDKTSFEFNNSGNVKLKIYTAATADAPVPFDAMTIESDDVVSTKGKTLGAITNTWLIIYNEDLNFSGSLDIKEIN